jgi:hypothetical protein
MCFSLLQADKIENTSKVIHTSVTSIQLTCLLERNGKSLRARLGHCTGTIRIGSLTLEAEETGKSLQEASIIVY